MGVIGRSGAIERFAVAGGLEFVPKPELPREGSVLSRNSLEVGSGALGELPGGDGATIAHIVFETTDSDGNATRHPLTVVVTRIPESIGFCPRLTFEGPESDLSVPLDIATMRPADIGGAEQESLGQARVHVYEGTNRDWTRQLFSPALISWLARSPDDFGFELTDGVFCAGRRGWLEAGDLQMLWEDAGHTAAAIRAEAREEAQSGTAGAAAAGPTGMDRLLSKMVEDAMAAFGPDRAVPDITAAVPAFRRLIARNPGAWLVTFLKSLGLTFALNLPGLAVPLLLIHSGSWLALALIEGGLVAIIFAFLLRRRVRDNAVKYSREAFFRTYAAERRLDLEDPLRFAASHAEADLPFRPERVMTGRWPAGHEGSLILKGDGGKRADRIALVAGPAGPIAEAELDTSPPGLSAANLDAYAERLAAELAKR